MNDFAAEPPELRTAALQAVERVLRSGWYILGEECRTFEEAWAAQCGVRFAVGVANGMDAIEIALRALEIGPGDEVITTPMTAFASVLAIRRAGAVPVLADIDARSALLSPESVMRCLSPRTKAVLPVHLYGQLGDMARWEALCRDRGILLLEDAAQAHLAKLGGRAAGSFGSAAAFSFYPTKNLGAPGDGGMLVTDSEAIAAQARILRNYGQSQRYHHPVEGLNSRLDELHAAILGVRLRWLPAFTARRREIAAAYQKGITNPQVRLLDEPADAQAHVWHLFVITCERREALAAHLASRGVQTLIHYPIPIHEQRPYVDLRRDPSGLRASEAHARTCLSLPCHPQLADAQVEQIIAAVNSFEG